jgi:integrase
MKIRFYLPRKDEKKNNIMMSVSWEGKRIQVSTKESLETKYWDFNRERVKNSHQHAIQLNNNLNLLKVKIENAYLIEKSNEGDTSKMKIREIVDNLLITDRIDTSENTDKFKSLYQEFIEERLSNPEFSYATIQKYRTAYNHLVKFEIETGWTCSFDTMNKEFYYKFKQYLNENKKLVDNTVTIIIKNLKVFLNWAVEKGEKVNPEYKKLFKTEGERTYHVALSKNDIEKLENIVLPSQRLSDVRNIFLLQCYTSLRYSDIKNLQPVKFNFENNTFTFHQVKTKKLTIVPIHQKVKKILENYPDLQLPKISNQKFNVYLKEVCLLAGLVEEIPVTKLYGGIKTEELKPKYSLISSHTGRRTNITFLILEKVPQEVIMITSGHKSKKAFDAYVNIEQMEAVDVCRKIWDSI